MLLSHRSASRSAEDRSKDRSELTNKLTNELALSLEWLCRSCPEELRGAEAHGELVKLMPRVREAIEALEDVEERRGLTEEERACRHAFMLLLDTGR